MTRVLPRAVIDSTDCTRLLWSECLVLTTRTKAPNSFLADWMPSDVTLHVHVHAHVSRHRKGSALWTNYKLQVHAKLLPSTLLTQHIYYHKPQAGHRPHFFQVAGEESRSLEIRARTSGCFCVISTVQIASKLPSTCRASGWPALK